MDAFIEILIAYDCTLAITEKLGGRYVTQVVRGHKKRFMLEDEGHRPFITGQIIIPCAREAVRQIKDFCKLQEFYGTALFYKSATMVTYPHFEPRGKCTGFGGPETAYRPYLLENDRTSPMRRLMKHFRDVIRKPVPPPTPRKIPMARYNCWTSARDIVQYVGELDLGRIDPELAYFYRAFHADDWAFRLVMGECPVTMISGRDGLIVAEGPEGHPFFYVKSGFDIPKCHAQPPKKGIERLLANYMSHKGKTITIADYLQIKADAQQILAPVPVSEHVHRQPGARRPDLAPARG